MQETFEKGGNFNMQKFENCSIYISLISNI